MYNDILYIPVNMLFCSMRCLISEYPEATVAECEEVDQEMYDTNHDENVESGNHWGALCPHCEHEYHCF